jgi:hypothetical protein
MARPQCDTPFVGLGVTEENIANFAKVYNYSEKQNFEYPVKTTRKRVFAQY